jgi:hypothetical protein
MFQEPTHKEDLSHTCQPHHPHQYPTHHTYHQYHPQFHQLPHTEPRVGQRLFHISQPQMDMKLLLTIPFTLHQEDQSPTLILLPQMEELTHKLTQSQLDIPMVSQSHTAPPPTPTDKLSNILQTLAETPMDPQSHTLPLKPQTVEPHT